MVQLSVETEKPTVCVVRDTCPGSLNDKISLQVRPSYLVKQLVEDVSTQFQYKQNEFELVLQAKKGGDVIVLNDLQHQTCSEIGLSFEEDAKNHLIVGPIVSHTRRKAMVDDDDMVLGASASPTAPLPPVAPAPLPALLSSEHLSSYIPQQPVGFVGLVNQAMTCYLNSLLQALYMTPEFRNALYNWQFDGNAETKSIPFQLQKLFLNLQTSTRSAVETTDLTRSFGWDSTEAWQQHDIQELCRVMFDALEQKFKKTQQSDLINRLYEGKMTDYVRCLQCGLEKSREDTFLDIPLPVRPFGSSVAYNSVEEALRAFVQPETLDGNNQYHCEKCNTKCDAYKGLKFSRFPYLLTLHLKRFDFDYQTLHRIKLNDKVTFPEILNLNGFIGGFDNITTESPEEISSASTSRPPEERQPCDDGSTTDSGSALDDECADKEIHINSTDPDYQDLDEGIDMSLSSGDRTNSNPERPGPYKYELFSIMIHSGSASGGHYYAYIKDFKTNRWYCFNDQSVTTITQEDIHKTYGGGPLKGYYSGAYTSSTNAYMLMYRQIDEQRNCVPIDVTEFPPHITELLQKCKEREESDRKNKEMELGMNKVKVFCNHPKKHEMVDTKLYIFNEATLDEATRDAHFKLELDDVVALDQCRLVSYDRGTETIDRSFEGRSEDQMGEILNSIKPNFQDLLLEIKHPDQKFKVYKPGGINTKIFYVDINTEEMDGPTLVRGNNSQTILEFKQTIVKELQLNVKAETLQLVIEKYSNGPKLLEDGVKLKTESLHGQNKFFVATAMDTDPDKPFSISKLHKIIDRFQHVITLHVSLPDTDNETLERMSIPPFDSIENVLPHQAVHSEAHPLGTNSPQQGGDVVDAAVVGGSPIPPLEGENSEDSSLSESDRTLVGDIPQCHLEGRLMEDEKPECWDTDPDEEEPHKTYTTQYFRATTYIENDQKMLKVLIDKRMIVGSLKNELQRYVGVPKEHFRLFKVYSPNQECECARLNESLGTFRDEEHLVVRLGRALRPGEHKGKVFLLKENSAEQTTFLCEWQLSVGVTVAQLKADLLHDKQLDIPLERCRIRKKNWKNPGKVYIDSMKFGDNIPIYSNWEVFLQDLEPPEETKIIETIIITNENHEYNKATALSSTSSNCSQTTQGGTSNPVVLPPRIWEKVTNTDQVVLFVRRWRPSLMKLERYEEVVLDGMSTQELKEKLSELSSIPIERIEFAKAPNHFPSDMSVLSIQSEMEWAPQTTALDLWPLNVSEDGGVFFYRDKDEPLKDLTAEERKQINSTEGIKLGRYGSSKTTSYSPRREKGLKIYLDNSPKKKDLVAD